MCMQTLPLLCKDRETISVRPLTREEMNIEVSVQCISSIFEDFVTLSALSGSWLFDLVSLLKDVTRMFLGLLNIEEITLIF